MREQERLEEDLYLRADVNERLRKQLNESERARSDAERRYTEQVCNEYQSFWGEILRRPASTAIKSADLPHNLPC